MLADGVESVRDLMEPVVEWHSSKTLRELCLGAEPDAKVADRVPVHMRSTASLPTGSAYAARGAALVLSRYAGRGARARR